MSSKLLENLNEFFENVQMVHCNHLSAFEIIHDIQFTSQRVLSVNLFR